MPTLWERYKDGNVNCRIPCRSRIHTAGKQRTCLLGAGGEQGDSDIVKQLHAVLIEPYESLLTYGDWGKLTGKVSQRTETHGSFEDNVQSLVKVLVRGRLTRACIKPKARPAFEERIYENERNNVDETSGEPQHGTGDIFIDLDEMVKIKRIYRRLPGPWVNPV